MQLIKKLVLLLLIVTFIGIRAFADDLSELPPAGEPLIDMANSDNSTSSANATAAMQHANASAKPLTNSNSTETPETQKAVSTAENATTEKTAQRKLNKASITKPAVSISDFNYLRSLIEIRKLEVALAKENKKLRELTTPTPEVSKSLIKKTASKKTRRIWPKVVSIQGVDGRLSATLSSPSGIETVKVGNNAGPGKVVSITPKKVLVRFNGKNIALKFKE